MILKLIGMFCAFQIILLFILDSFGVEHIPKEIKTFMGKKT